MNIHSLVRNKTMTDKKTRKEKLTRERQKQILDAAIEVFARKGYEAATMPDIAKATGVAAGTLYLYFPNKRELFIASIKNSIITPPLLDLIGKIPRGNFKEVLKNIILERFDLIKNNSAAVSRIPSLISEIQRDPELKELWLKDFLKPFLNKMEMAYRILNATGKTRHVEPPVLVRMIGGMVLGFLMLRMMEGESSPINKLPPEKVAEEIVEFVVHGLMNGRQSDASGERLSNR
jgi:AcrR family transcriptional regulator